MSRRTSHTAQDLLGQLLALFGPGVRLLHAHEREWASITFTGARHRMVFEIAESALESPRVQLALAALPDHQFQLRAEIVADCTATLGMPMPGDRDRQDRLLVVELLTVVAH